MINPRFFSSRETFVERVDQLVHDAKSVKPAEGFSEVLLPGELEWREEQRRREEGIPLYDGDESSLPKILEAASVPRYQLPGSAAHARRVGRVECPNHIVDDAIVSVLPEAWRQTHRNDRHGLLQRPGRDAPLHVAGAPVPARHFCCVSAY